jgi:predicted small integral membrane protein
MVCDRPINSKRNNMFEWMARMTPVAVFCSCIVLMFAGATVGVEVSHHDAWFFAVMETTRGDRLFIGLL